jgi:hypothetical protein
MLIDRAVICVPVTQTALYGGKTCFRHAAVVSLTALRVTTCGENKAGVLQETEVLQRNILSVIKFEVDELCKCVQSFTIRGIPQCVSSG